jgi:aspartyl-tRNA(Asn)/glutamyl-tRNA(Gln) amidotransferase subunit C
MALTRKEVEEIALLARLHLADDELERMQGDLGAILEHFQTIAAVDTTGIPPLTHAVAIESPLRVDEPQPPLPVELALRGTAKRDGDLIVVPSIIPGARDE